MTMANGTYDLVVVGAGIVGLGQALAAVEHGLKVAVIDREQEAIGASVRNFGFVTVTGQEAGQCWQRAMRSRDRWLEVAPQAGIPVEHAGLVVSARRPEAMAVLEAFKRTDMGTECELIGANDARVRFPQLAPGPLEGALWSPHERRVESRSAVGKLAAWLAAAKGVHFQREAGVTAVESGTVHTSDGPVHGRYIAVCPGDDLPGLFPELIAKHEVRRCKLHMLKVMPGQADWRVPGAVMSDLSLIRYRGYSALPEAAALRQVLEREAAEMLDHGIHLIVVQGSDGGLIVGDSHHYGRSPSPFDESRVDDLILEEMTAVLDVPAPRVVERWTGTYASADKLMFMEKPMDRVRLTLVTSGTGASTAFAIGEEVIDDLLGDA